MRLNTSVLKTGLAVLVSLQMAATLAQDKADSDYQQRIKKLQSVTALTANEAMQHIREFRGMGLPLDSVKVVTKDVAEVLAQHDSLLSLDGIAHVDDAAAQALSRTKGTLSMEGLVSLTNEALAQKFASQPGELNLARMKKVDPPIDGILARARGQVVLNGLETLDSPDLAGKLASSETVHLDRLKELNAEVAKALATGPNRLYLKGITHLPLAVAKELRAHQGPTLDLDCCATADPGAIEEIAQCKGALDLGVTALTVAEAKALAGHDGILTLANLTQASPAVLAELREHRHILYLTSLQAQAFGAAEARSLSGCKGVIYLTGLDRIDQQTADALAGLQMSVRSAIVLDAALSQVPVASILKKNRRLAFGSHRLAP